MLIACYYSKEGEERNLTFPRQQHSPTPSKRLARGKKGRLRFPVLETSKASQQQLMQSSTFIERNPGDNRNRRLVGYTTDKKLNMLIGSGMMIETIYDLQEQQSELLQF